MILLEHGVVFYHLASHNYLIMTYADTNPPKNITNKINCLYLTFVTLCIQAEIKANGINIGCSFEQGICDTLLFIWLN